jgi:hypothetical protein
MARGVAVEVEDLVGDEVMIGCVDVGVEGDINVMGTVVVVPSIVAMTESCDEVTELATPFTQAV